MTLKEQLDYLEDTYGPLYLKGFDEDVREAVLEFKKELGLDNYKDGEFVELDSKEMKILIDEIFGDFEKWK